MLYIFYSLQARRNDMSKVKSWLPFGRDPQLAIGAVNMPQKEYY
jgi:hypothetical protein